MTTYNTESTKSWSKRSALCSLSVTAIGVAYTCLMLSGSALAQNVKKAPIAEEDSTVYVVGKVQEEKKKVTDEISQITASANDLAAKQSQAEQKRDDFEQKGRAFANSDEVKQFIKDHEAHDAACARGGLSAGEYARCQSTLVSINERTDRVNATIESYVAQFRAQRALAQQLANDHTLAMARIEKLKNYLSWLTAADGKLSMALAKSCKNMPGNATIEELKHRCGNIQFDAARADLPACETERCEAWVRYAKPQRTPEQAIQDYRNSGQQNPTPNPLLDRRPVPPPPKP